MTALPVTQVDLYKSAQLARFSSRNKTSVTTPAPKLDELFSCGICRELLYEAVSATCGHTFCAACWFAPSDHLRLAWALTERLSLGVNSSCPVCKRETGPLVCNRAIDSLITKLFPEEIGERAKQSVSDRLKRQLLPELTEQVRRELVEQIRSEEAARHAQRRQRHIAVPVENFGYAAEDPAGDPDDGAEMVGAQNAPAGGRARPEPIYNHLHQRGVIRGVVESLIHTFDYERNFVRGADGSTGQRVEALLGCITTRLVPIFRGVVFGLLLVCIYGVIAALGYLQVIADAQSTMTTLVRSRCFR